MNASTRQDMFGILFFADDPVDILVMMDVVKKAYLSVSVKLASDVMTPLEETRTRSNPDVIVLDLGLRQRNPYDVLAAVKTDPDLGGVPMAVLGEPDSEADIDQSFASGADIYIAKPMDLQRFTILLNWAKGF